MSLESAHILGVLNGQTEDANPNEVKMSVALIVFTTGGGIGMIIAAAYLFRSIKA